MNNNNNSNACNKYLCKYVYKSRISRIVEAFNNNKEAESLVDNPEKATSMASLVKQQKPIRLQCNILIVVLLSLITADKKVTKATSNQSAHLKNCSIFQGAALLRPLNMDVWVPFFFRNFY